MPKEVHVKIKKLPHASDLNIPAKATGKAAGFDLSAAITANQSVQPGAFSLIPTGIAVSIPPGYEGQVRPRSGLALKHGLSILNTPGTIDSDYRGEVKVIIINFGSKPYTINRGERIAQLVIAAVPEVSLEEVSDLEDTPRGQGGFGHTGK